MTKPILVAAFVTVTLAAQAPRPFDAKAHEIYKQLVEINTTDTPAGNVTIAAEAVAARLKAAGFPAADVQVIGPNERKKNLVARYRGTGAKKPLILMAHLDVVEARREDWTTDPFAFVEKDGWVYGRGTGDDKAMASVLAANLIRLKGEGFKPNRDLVLLLTADEEGGQFNGIDWLVKNHHDLIDGELALNEGGGGQMKNGKRLVLEVQASEKVYVDFTIETKNKGGHSSRPVKENAIYQLAGGLSRLARLEFPLNMSEVTRGYFNKMAALQTDPTVAADMRAVAQVPPDAGAAARLAASSPYYNALMRTTCVATRLDGGHANNALPQMAKSNVNCRILPGESPDGVKDAIVKALADPAIEVTSVAPAKPSSPSLLTRTIMQPIESIAASLWPGVIVVPVMGAGATDGLYLRNAGIPTYGVTGLFGEMDDNRAHGRDERVNMQSYYDSLEFQYRLIKALASPADGTH